MQLTVLSSLFHCGWLLPALAAATVSGWLMALFAAKYGFGQPCQNETVPENRHCLQGRSWWLIPASILPLACLCALEEPFGAAFAAPTPLPPPLIFALIVLLSALVLAATLLLTVTGWRPVVMPVVLVYLFVLFSQPGFVDPVQLLTGGAAALMLALLSVQLRFLDPGGAMASFLMGTTIFGIGGMVWALPMLAFYILSSVLSKLGKKRKAHFDLVFEKGSRRDAGQVYANGGVAWVLMVIFSLTHDPVLYFAYLGTLAAVQADTWATEIGTIWPNPKAWLITTLQEVPVGTSGGISLPGTLAALSGSLLVASSALLTDNVWTTDYGSMETLIVTSLAGLAGSLVDSLFGATIQAQYFDPVRNKITERTKSLAPDGTTVCNTLVKGIAVINNDIVNLACALSGSTLVYGIVRSIHQFH